jgi:chromosome segregation ATPase
LRQELDELNARARACSEQAARIQALINGLKGDKYPEITRQINDLDGKISASRTRVTEIDNALAGAAGPLADLRSKLTQAQDDLTFIRSQRTGSEDALRAAYQRGNDANNRVAFARQNLDAVVKRFQDESRIVSDATLNLESARAE